MKVMITGRGGQLASALEESAPQDVEIHALSASELDITSSDQVRDRVSAIRPEVIINGAAYTAVDKAEEETDIAEQVNAGGPMNLARAASDSGCRIVQPSTDFVFDGDRDNPWPIDGETNPLSVYGRTKLAGEIAVSTNCRTPWIIVRTAWVYSRVGSNFVLSMLNHMRNGKSLRIIDDQHGTPTSARSLSEAIWCMLDRNIEGVHHWTDDGSTTWYGFARAISEIGLELGILESIPQITPIPTSEYPTPATRPAYSVLDKSVTWSMLEGSACMPVHDWRDNLKLMMMELNNV